MSSASSGGTRPTKSDRDPRIRDLQASVVATRTALEVAQRKADDRVQALQANPNDKVAAMYRDQCRVLVENPPPRDWDSTSVLAQK